MGILETALLLVLASDKHAGEIHALSVNQGCTKFSSWNIKAPLQDQLSFYV